MQSSKGLSLSARSAAKRDGCVGALVVRWQTQKTPKRVPSDCSSGIPVHHCWESNALAVGAASFDSVHPSDRIHFVAAPPVSSPCSPRGLSDPSSRQIPVRSPTRPFASATYDVKIGSGLRAERVALLTNAQTVGNPALARWRRRASSSGRQCGQPLRYP
jgi:hypothetical protein